MTVTSMLVVLGRSEPEMNRYAFGKGRFLKDGNIILTEPGFFKAYVGY